MNDSSEAKPTPLCLGCLKPAERARHFCTHCGRDTGQFTQYMPFEGIQWMAQGYGTAWQRLWHDGRYRWAARAGLFLFVAVFAPIMLVGLPFVFLARRANSQS